MVTDLQKRSAEAIVNVFETGTPRGDYGQVTVVPGDTGHLTYGRSQTTLASVIGRGDR
jgi:chitosanase